MQSRTPSGLTELDAKGIRLKKLLSLLSGKILTFKKAIMKQYKVLKYPSGTSAESACVKGGCPAW